MIAEIIPLRSRQAPRYAVWEPVLDAKGRKIPGLRRHKESGVIHVRKTFKKLGIPTLSETTGEATLGKAKSKSVLLIQQHVNKYLGVDDSHALLRKKEKTFGYACDWVLENYTPSQRIKTQNNHHFYIGELKEHWGQLDPNVISAQTFKKLIETLRRKKKKSNNRDYRRRTFFDTRKVANLVMRFAYENKWVTHRVTFPDPDKAFKNTLENKIRKDVGLTPEEKEILELKSSRLLTRAELNSLWEKLNEDTKDQFVLSFECMMRLSEGLLLTWDRCDVKTGIVTLRPEDVKTGSKTGKGRAFKMTPHAILRMGIRYKSRDPKSPFVFPSPKNPQRPTRQNKTAWRTAKREAKIIGKCRWHDLRHTALTFALLGDPALPAKERVTHRKNPLIISEYAGVSIKTIQNVYLKTDTAATEDAAEAVKIIDLENGGNVVGTGDDAK